MRLDKYLAHAGYGTRKEVKQLIRKKRIQVNQQIVSKDDVQIDEVNDLVHVDGECVIYQKYVYYMMNKPQGVISATSDAKQQTVMDLFEEFVPLDAFPVGRLDIDTTGLLLISNDGALAHELLAPKKHVDKVYEVSCANIINEEQISRLEAGVTIEPDEVCKPAKVKLVNDQVMLLTIHEGKFHQVKRMLLAVGNEVIQLKRIQMGSLKLDEDLVEGCYRPLSISEVKQLKNEEEKL